MIILIDKNPDLIAAWNEVFPYDVPIVHGDIFSVRTETLVSPGNSSGAMTGGLDLAISQRWPHIEPMVRASAPIEVGDAKVIRCIDEKLFYTYGVPFRNLLYVPTMVGAMDISETENVYLAMKAIISYGYLLGTIAISGLGTGVGKMPAKKAAEQMARAYRESY